MLIFFSILCGILASTLLWMRIASRQLAAAKLHAWRWGVWIFGGMQLLAFVIAFSGRFTPVRLPPWKGVITPIYLWFLIIAPATLVIIALADVIRRGIGLFGKTNIAQQAASASRGDASTTAQEIDHAPPAATSRAPSPGATSPRAIVTRGPAVPDSASAAATSASEFRPLASSGPIDPVNASSEASHETSDASQDMRPGTAGSGLTRRRFLALSVAAIPPLLNLGATGLALHQLSHFRIRNVTLPFASLPAGLDGFRIALLADIHCGQFTRGVILDRIVQATQSLHADIILFAGDLIDYSLDDLPAGIATLQKLKAPYGVHCIEGNHDLFQSRVGFERPMAQAGLPLLLNEGRTIYVNGTLLQLLGLRWGDQSTMRGSAIAGNFQQMIRHRDPDKFGILLAHHPDAFDLAAQAGIPLTLAGHTHGGQLMLTPSFGAGSLMFKYYTGLYQQGDSSLFVSNGIGNWFPLRINAPAEIVHITLKKNA